MCVRKLKSIEEKSVSNRKKSKVKMEQKLIIVSGDMENIPKQWLKFPLHEQRAI